MIGRGALALMLFLYGSGDACVSAEDGSELDFRVSELSAMARRLRHAGDGLAMGASGAEAQRRDTLSKIAEQLAAMDLQELRRPESAAAMLAVVLNGGPMQTLVRVLEDDNWIEPDRDLARALLALRRGAPDEATMLLEKVPRNALSDAVRKPLALVEAKLYADREANLALSRLQETRIDVPGTGLEEAVLRQEIIVLMKLGQTRRGGEILASYLRRYPRSAYWASFMPLLVKTISALEKIEARDFTEPARTVNTLDGAEHYCALMLQLSQRALMAGEFQLAAELAEFVLANEPARNGANHTAQLYRAVAGIAFEPAKDWLAALQGLDVSSYAPQEQQFIRVAIGVARDVLGGFGNSQGSLARAPPPSSQAQHKFTDQDIAAASPLTTDLASRAERALRSAQESLGEAKQ